MTGCGTREVDVAAVPVDAPSSGVRSASRLARSGPWLRQDDGAIAALLRFVLVGGSANVVYVLAFWLLAGSGSQLANAVGSLASTMVANELHRRFTFHARSTVRWYTAQWEGGGLAVAGLALTSLALVALGQLVDQPSTAIESAMIVSVTCLVGLVRFLVLRVWFRPGRPRRGEGTDLGAEPA